MLGFPLGILSAAGADQFSSDYELIGTGIASGTGPVIFTSIPQTYKHLQIRAVGRSTGSGIAIMGMQFNSDTGGNYARAWHILEGTGSAVQSDDGGASGFTTIWNAREPGTATTSTIFAAAVIDILDYTNTSKNKTVRALGGYTASTHSITLTSGVWLNTSAITGIEMNDNASPFYHSAGSRFSLYGIKG